MADQLDFGQDLARQALVEQDGIGLGQLGTADADCGRARIVVPFRRDVELLEEGLVVAAFDLLAAAGVDRCHVLGQLQGHAEHVGVELKPLLSLGERLFGGCYLSLHTAALGSEGVGGYVVALFGMEPDQSYLLSLELGYQVGLGLLDLDYGLLADLHKRFDRLRAPLHLLGRELDGSLAVVALDGLLDQLGAHVGTHGTLGSVDPSTTEEVGVALAVLAAAQPVAQSLTAVAAVDGALQVVVMHLRALGGKTLFIESFLDAIKGVSVDQRHMATLEDLFIGRATLVDDQTGVVGVA